MKEKKKIYKIRYFLCTLGICISILAGSPFIISLATTISEAQNQKTKLEQKRKVTEEKLRELENEKGNIIIYIEKLDKQMSEITIEISKLNNEIVTAQKQLKKTKEELKEAKQTEKNQYNTMKKRIKYTYENDGSDYIELLLHSESISDLLNRAEYISKIAEYDQTMFDRYQTTKENVKHKEEEQKETLHKLQSLEEELEYEQDTVQLLIDNKTEEVTKYEKNIKNTKSIVSEYSLEIKKQEGLIEQLLEQERKRIEEEERKKKEEQERKRREEEERKQAQTSNQNKVNSNGNATNFSSSSNSTNTNFIWPLPSSRRITSGFGNRAQPTAGATTYHNAIDIGATTGANILAASGGTVVISRYSVSAGNYIMISHGNGVYTVYMHMSALLCTEGSYVSQGQVIGLVGSTGYSTGSHLHFGISINGTYVNPLNYVG